MNRRRLALQAAIVVVVLALLSLPYVLPDRAGSNPSPSHSWAYCAEFRVGRTPPVSADDAHAGPATWTASFTISNAGPHGAIVQTGSIISRIWAGSESWPVSLGGRLLRPGATASIKIPLPVQADDDEDRIRIRASATQEPGDEGREVRVADVLGAGPAHENPSAALHRAMELWCGPQDLPSPTVQPVRTTPLQPAGASDSRR